MIAGWQRTGQLWTKTVRAGIDEGATLPVLELAAGAALPDRWVQLVAWQAPQDVQPQPLVLQVEVAGIVGASPGEGAPATLGVGAFGGAVRAAPPGWGQWPRRAMLEVVYGSWGGASRRWLDPRTGSYALPPSRYVSVSARAYRTQGADWLPYELTVGVAPGELQAPAAPVYSGVTEITGSGSQIWVPPSGARDVRLGVIPDATSDAVVSIDGTQPGQQMGPAAWDQAAPPADLAPLAAACTVAYTATAGSCLAVVETGLQW